jgi:predicted transcriptional regulator
LIDLSDSQAEALDALAKAEKTSRPALIRQAIDDYLSTRQAKRREDAFGLWGRRKVDGLAYQKKVRSAW